MTPAERLRALTSLLVLALLALQVPTIAVLTVLVSGTPSLTEPAVALLSLGMALAAWRFAPAPTARLVMAVSLPVAASMSVVAVAGHPWQTAMVTYVHVLTALLVGFSDWRCVGTAVATTVLLTLSAFLANIPGVGGGDVLQILAEVWLTIFGGALLGWLAMSMARAFDNAAAALADAESAHASLTIMMNEREEAEKRAKQERGRLLTTVAEELEAKVGGLAGEVASEAAVAATDAESLHTLVAKGSKASEVMADDGREALTGAEAVAAASQQLSGAIAEVSGQTAHCSALARSAADIARTTQSAVLELRQAADSIQDVVSAITEIAETINLLALNASIEAARAGEAGKGFAVVASEVKHLAGQTAKATAQVGERIAAIRHGAGSAAEAVTSILEAVFKVDAASAAIVAAVEEQDAATRKIAGGAAEAARIAQSTAAGGSDMVANWGDASHRADSVSALAGRVAERTDRLRNALTQLLDRIRAEAH